MNLDMPALETFSKKNNVAMILLFGSRASDRFQENSDVDLGILFKDGYYNYQQIVQGLVQLFPTYKLDVAVLNHSDPLLNFQILSRCEILYCPDMEVYLRFFADTVKKHHDMQKIYRLADRYLKDFTGGAALGTKSCYPPKVNESN